jgi:hypothetical protein
MTTQRRAKDKIGEWRAGAGTHFSMLHMGLPGRSMSSQTNAARGARGVMRGSDSKTCGSSMARAEKSSTCEELNLFGRAALVERVSPALSLGLHHRVVVVPATACEDKQKKKAA